MTVLGLVVCVIAIAVVENEQYKDLRDRNKRQGLAYGLSLFFFLDIHARFTSNVMETNNKKTQFKRRDIMKNKENIVVAMMLTVVMAVVITMGVSMGPSLREGQPSYEEVHEFLSLGIDE